MEVITNISSWDEFWIAFKKVCSSLLANQQTGIIANLEDAKSWVDNNHEEWFEFSYALDGIIEDGFEAFHESEKISLIALKNYLDKYLYY